MKIFKTLKQLILQTDFFYSSEMLRYNAELQYKTLTGGVISLGIIVTIIVGFASMILNTLDLSSISTSTQIIKNQDPPSSSISVTPDSPFRFAVEIWYLNLSDTKRYFDVTFQHWYWQDSQLLNATNIPLQTCSREYFKDYPEITNSFESLGTGRWLCPSLNLNMDIYGKYSSKKYSEYVAVVSACNNATNPQQPCATPEEIKAYMDAKQDYVYFTVYFTNTQINPDRKNYKQYYLEDKSYSIFGSSLGSQSYLYFTDYTVSTDYSIWPFTSQVDDKGVLVQSLAVNHPFQTNINNIFVYFAFVKGSNSIVYSRQVQKLSAVFSFMGGMIGAVSAVLFFVKVYTSLSYEFSIAFELFRQEKNHGQGQEEQPKELFSFNFLNFIRYNLYVLLKKMGINISWPQTIEYAKQCRGQILKQLDVKALLKRIIFIEHCLNYMIEDYQLDALQIKKPTKPDEIRLIRKKFESVIDHDPDFQEYPTEFQTEVKVEQNMEPIEQQAGNTPSQLILNSQSRKSKKIVSFKFENISGGISSDRKKEEKIPQKIENLVIVDFENIKDLTVPKQQENQSGSGRQRLGVVRRSKIQNQYEFIKKRSTYLSKLKQDAEDGNQISNKIWRHLNQKYKQDLENAKK